MSKRTSRYPGKADGEWIQPRVREFWLRCCDCGLVHRMKFRTVDSPRGRKIQFAAWRDRRRTAQSRRWMLRESIPSVDESDRHKIKI
jgi:hypothetical protein